MKVLLIDDHPLILAALKAMLEAMSPGLIVFTEETAAGAHQLLATQRGLNLVLLDLTLADADGFETLVRLRAEHPQLPVVALSEAGHLAEVVRAVDGGAMAVVSKRSSTDELGKALGMVMRGSVYVPPRSKDPRPPVAGPVPAPAANPGPPPGWAGLVARIADGDEAALVPSPAAAQAPPPAVAPAAAAAAAWPAGFKLSGLGLTPRQTEVMTLLLQGLPNKLIARQLNLSVETVKDHVAAVLRALGVSNRTQAVLAVGQLQPPAV